VHKLYKEIENHVCLGLAVANQNLERLTTLSLAEDWFSFGIGLI